MNKTFEIVPLENVGGIRFGMTRADVRKLIGEPLTEFRKTRRSVNTTDDYGDFHVYYTADNTCEAVELFGGCTACSNGQVLFPLTRTEFVEWLRSIDSGCETAECDALSVKMSVGASFENEKVVCVLFARNGYYAD